MRIRLKLGLRRKKRMQLIDLRSGCLINGKYQWKLQGKYHSTSDWSKWAIVWPGQTPSGRHSFLVAVTAGKTMVSDFLDVFFGTDGPRSAPTIRTV
jgi:hypothetical protein